MEFDVIVIGLGGMGSAAACHLAARRQRVLGLEQFTPAHDRGSSHGRTRVIRQSYFEDPAYVPLLLRAYELWRALERETGASLLHEVGGLMIGAPSSDVVRGSLRSANAFGLEHEMLDARELRRRFPVLQPDAQDVALLEHKAGYVHPEQAVSAHLARAAALGAELRFKERMVGWAPSGDGVTVRTDRGTHEAARLVITPGPWAPEILADLGLPLTVERQVLYWFDPPGGVEPFLPGRFPIFIWDIGDGSTPYGFPALDGPRGGVKVAFYHAPAREFCTPGTIDRNVREAEIDRMRTSIMSRIPALPGPCLHAVSCMYTNTPDCHFVIATLPRCPQVSVACGFSGHGFKFCSVVGEILADLATRGQTHHDITLFDPRRLKQPTGRPPGRTRMERAPQSPCRPGGLI